MQINLCNIVLEFIKLLTEFNGIFKLFDQFIKR